LLEIEAGNYRLLAHSSYSHLPVEIRIIHQVDEENKVLSYSHQYYRRSNEKGLIEIIPFTILNPGSCYLRCYPDVFSEILTHFWQEELQLKVVASQQQLLKYSSKINLFNPNKSITHHPRFIPLSGQILPPKIKDKSSIITSIELPPI
jgi:hypothetical protein